MGSTKSPISCLQEIMASKQLPLPIYSEIIVSSGFGYSCKAAGLETTGQATTKKMAKQYSAENLLKLLLKDDTSVKSENNTQNIKINQNYIGKLNEYCAKYQLSYPVYSLDHNVSGIMVNCSLENYVAKGNALNKKEAKQIAAMKMLELCDKNPPIRLTQITQEDDEPKLDEEKIQQLINLYKNLSAVENFNKIEIVGGNDKPSSKSNMTTNIDFNQSVEELEEILKTSGVRYHVMDIQKNPFIVSLIINNGDVTLMGIGETREQALLDALLGAMKIRNLGVALNDSIFEIQNIL